MKNNILFYTEMGQLFFFTMASMLLIGKEIKYINLFISLHILCFPLYIVLAEVPVVAREIKKIIFEGDASVTSKKFQSVWFRNLASYS